MTCYRFLLARPDRVGFLDSQTIDQSPEASLIVHAYGDERAIEFWMDPAATERPLAVNDTEPVLPA